MKGQFIAHLYASKKVFITYFIISILMCVGFNFLNPIMTCFLPMMFLLSPISDNMKQEKESHWMYYVATLPGGRKGYINSYFTFVVIAFVIGSILGVGTLLIFQQSWSIIVLSFCLGVGAMGIYSFIFPFTFKFGTENSNVIMITVTIVLMLSFFGLFYGMIMPNITESGSFERIIYQPIAATSIISYGVLGVILLIVSYLCSIAIFSKQEL
ncbi:ABC-2 transporter permease [Staphylococcus sp. SQ8-PEA]|uniref:ABC-2 transporter permease n=1 Tax=Staphylococcus marylandisciuri TaxID=2981529 RepID=A0ABT2QQR4_9STAP|nr:ABC-2 transporter permease [Staphylococcus marylandisciuri]MCU5746324.1 ABC-2 transporter permease [Staphylococcus marylandisciuri]